MPTQSKKQPTKKANSKSAKAFNIYVTISLVGLLFGMFMIVVFFPDTIITVSTIATLIFILGIILNLAILPLGLKKNQKGKTLISEVGTTFFILLNFAGGGIFLTGLMMMLNFAGRSPETISEHYVITGKDPMYRAGSYSGIVYLLEDFKHPAEVDLRWFELKDIRNLSEKGHLEIRYSEGLLGLLIFEERGITSDLQGTDYVKTPLLGEGYQ